MKKLLSVIVVLAMVCSLPVPAFAVITTRVWNGTNIFTGIWSSGTNWVGGVAPAANNILEFGGTTRLTTNTNDIAAGTQFNGITFNNTAGAFTLSGNDIVLGGDIVNNDDSLQTISFSAAGGGIKLFSVGRTLQTASTGGLTVTSKIDNNGCILTNNAAANTIITLSGIVSNTGGLANSGAGTLTLGGANTYSGGTLLNAGTLQIAADSVGAVGAITSSAVGTGTLILNGGTLSSDSATARTLYNTVTFASNVTLGDAVNTGVLTFEGAGTLTGNRTFATASDVIYNGAIGEDAAGRVLTKDGAGTLTLGGLNTYTGGTTVNAGTLALTTHDFASNINFSGDAAITVAGDIGITGNITNTTTNNGTLTLLQGTHVITGDIGSTGAGLKLINVGGHGETADTDVTISGDIRATQIDFVGDDEDFAKNLHIGDGSTITTDAAFGITSSAGGNSNLIFDGSAIVNSNIGTLVPVPNGPMEVLVNGAGSTVIFNGAIVAQTITIDNPTATAVIGVSSTSACLGMNLTRGTLDLRSNTLTFPSLGMPVPTCNYTQAAGTTLKTTIQGIGVAGNIDASAADGGVCTIDPASTLAITLEPGYIPNGTTWTIIKSKAGTAGVQVPAITSNSTRYTFAGTAANGGDDLTITASIPAGGGFAGTARTGDSNAAAAGGILDNIQNPAGDMLNVLNTLIGLGSAQVASALDTVVPIVDGGITQTSNTSLNQFIGTATQRMEGLYAQARNEETGVSTGSEELKGIDVWGQGFGEYAHQDPRGLSNGYCATIWGTAIGGDVPVFNDRIRLGLSGGYAQSDINSKDNSGATDINSYQATLYGGYIDGENPYYINGAFSFAFNKYDGSRHIAVGAITRTANADYDGQQYSVLVDGGYTFKVKNLRITPIASLQYLRLHLESYTETNAGALNLSLNSQNYDMLESGLGMKFERPFDTESATIIPEVHAKWLYDIIDDNQATTSTFSGGGGSFATQGFNPARNALDLGTRLTLATKANWTLDANYDFEYKEDFTSHTGWADIRYRF